LSFSGVIFAALWYLWPWLEKGQVTHLSFQCRGKALPSTNASEIAETIAEHIAHFDFTNKGYAYYYIWSELLNLSACMATFAYYAWLLDINKCYDYLDVLKYYMLRETDSHLILLFPREYECAYLVAKEKTIEEKYGKFLQYIKCKVTYQQLNETFHLLALLVSLIVTILFVINLIYTITIVARIQDFAKSPSDKDIKKLKKLSLAKRLVIIFLHYNMDALTHLTLISNILSMDSKNKDNKNNTPDKTSDKTVEKTSDMTSDNTTDNQMINHHMAKIFTEVLMSDNDTDSDPS
jgi:hypothetical protein